MVISEEKRARSEEEAKGSAKRDARMNTMAARLAGRPWQKEVEKKMTEEQRRRRQQSLKQIAALARQ